MTTAFDAVLALGQCNDQGMCVADEHMQNYAAVVATHGVQIADALLQAAELTAALENAVLHQGHAMTRGDVRSRTDLVDGMRKMLEALGVAS